VCESQTLTDDFDLIQSVYGMEKREIFQEFLGEQVNKEFWSIYKEYEEKRSSLGKKRFELLKAYSRDYLDMTDDKASQSLKSAFRLNTDFNNLITNYTRKIEKSFGGNVAMQFYQLEHYFLGLTRTELVENIPTIADMLKGE
jgi:hypothetical protein